MKREIIENYAKLIVKTGVNVQKGQEVFITGSIEVIDFIRLVTKECYSAGASRVFVDFTDTELERLNIAYGDEENFKHLNEMEIGKQEHFIKNHPCRIFIESDDPDALKGIDQNKYGRILSNKSKEIWAYRAKWDDECQWCIAGFPSLKWAKKVYPNLEDEEAKEALLELILKVSRAFEGDPIENWKKHNDALVSHMNKLNSLNLRKLHYTSKKGTDLTVTLIPDVIFEAGGECTKTKKILFQPNIPTEECFTSPDKFKTEGIVYATKPLSLRGEIVEDFYLRFHEGKIIEVHAKKGEQVLKDAIYTNENGCYLGECALVPIDSPINQTNILFFSTLYDENASCHLAFGKAFPMLIKDYDKKTSEEIKAYPLNDSTTHVDFMIGDETLDIVGTDRDGKEILIFKQGRWAI